MLYMNLMRRTVLLKPNVVKGQFLYILDMLRSIPFVKFNKSELLNATAAKTLQSCPTLCNPIDCSLPGFSVHGILQAWTLEWVAISFSKAWKWKVNVKVKSLSRVRSLATPWTAAYQAPPSMGFSRQQYWSGVPLPSPNYWINYIKNQRHTK